MFRLGLDSVQIHAPRSVRTVFRSLPLHFREISMLERLAHLVVRRRRATLALFVLGLVVAGALGSGGFSRLQAARYTAPGSDSTRAAEQLRQEFGAADPVAAIAVVTRHGPA